MVVMMAITPHIDHRRRMKDCLQLVRICGPRRSGRGLLLRGARRVCGPCRPGRGPLFTSAWHDWNYGPTERVADVVADGWRVGLQPVGWPGCADITYALSWRESKLPRSQSPWVRVTPIAQHSALPIFVGVAKTHLPACPVSDAESAVVPVVVVAVVLHFDQSRTRV